MASGQSMSFMLPRLHGAAPRSTSRPDGDAEGDDAVVRAVHHPARAAHEAGPPAHAEDDHQVRLGAHVRGVWIGIPRLAARAKRCGTHREAGTEAADHAIIAR